MAGRSSSILLLFALAGIFALSLPAASAEPPEKDRARGNLPAGAVLRFGSSDFAQGERPGGLAVLDGGKRIATVSNRHLIIWDVASGRIDSSRELPPVPDGTMDRIARHPLPGDLVATPDGSALVAARERSAIFYKLPLDKHAPAPLPFPPSERRRIVGLAPGAKGDTILCITDRGAVLAGRAGDGQWATLNPAPPERQASFGVSRVAYGGGVVAAWSLTKDHLSLWDAAKGKYLGAQDVKGVCGVAVSGDGKRFITRAGPEFNVRSLPDQKSVASWKVDRKLDWSTGRVALSHDGALAAVGYSPSSPYDWNKVDIYEVATGRVRRTLPTPGGAWRLEFLPSGDLVTVDEVAVIQVWDVAAGQPRHKSAGHRGAVNCLICAPGGRWFSGDSQGVILAWDAKGNELRRLAGHRQAVTGLALSKDGKTLYSAGQDGTVREWDPATGRERRKCTITIPRASRLNSLALSADGRRLAAGATDDDVQVFDTEELTLEDAISPKGGRSGPIYGVTFVSNTLVASRSLAGKIQIWSVGGSGEFLRAIDTGDGPFIPSARVAAAPGGNAVASPLSPEIVEPRFGERAEQTEVGMWGVGTGKLLERIKTGAQADLTALLYLPGGKLLAVGDEAGVVRVIDLEKKATRQVLTGHRGPVLSLAASPDGKTLSSGGADTTVLVWKLERP